MSGVVSKGWGDWFAWYPVKVDGRYVFLKTVQRRFVWFPPHYGHMDYVRKEYRRKG